MSCNFGVGPSVGSMQISFGIDGSNLCTYYTVDTYGAIPVSFPLTDTDLSIADAIVSDMKANLTSDQLLAIKRGFNIHNLVLEGLKGV